MSDKKIAVLVVEDEPLVRMVIAAELEDHGLEVLEAGNALEAIKIMDFNPVIDVLFTDVYMPGGLDGLELAREVKARYPLIQVIVTSGHRLMASNDLPVEGTFIPKPYLSDSVVQTILDIVRSGD